MTGMDPIDGAARGADAEGAARHLSADRAQRLVTGAGIEATVRAAGVNGEIAAVTGSPAQGRALAALAPELRALGFQYVALEIDNVGSRDIQDS